MTAVRRLNVIATGMWYSTRSGAIRRQHRHGKHCYEPCPWVRLYIEAT